MIFLKPKKSSSCIIVGNGEGAIDKSRAAVIDSYDVVVRMNRFRVAGYEEVLGKKCTHWVLNCALTTDERNYAVNNIERVKKETIGLREVLVLTANTKGRGRRLKEIARVLAENYDIKVRYKIFSRWIMRRLLRLQRKPSTGFVAILYFLKRYREITLVGFDFGSSDHYWGNFGQKDIPGKHDWDTEKKFIMKYRERGRIKFL